MASYAPVVYTSTAGQTNYAFTFETIEQADVNVKVAGVLTTSFTITGYTTTGGGTIVLSTAPAAGTRVEILRATDIDDMNATFQSGSAIRAADLNGDFTQLRNAIQETNEDIYFITNSNVTRLVAGNNISLNPASGVGEVTITGAEGSTYLGLIDLVEDNAPADPANGDFYVNTATSGNVNNTWTGISGTEVVGAERVVYNGSTAQWEMPPSFDLWTKSGNDIYYNDGNVGIGTDAPNFLLHLDGGHMHRFREATGTSATPHEDALVTYGSTTAPFGGMYAINQYSTDTRTDLAFKVTNNTGSIYEALRIRYDGNVGIGTDDPQSELHISNNAQLGITLERTGSAPSTASIRNEGQQLILAQNTDGIVFKTGSTPTERMSIDINGNTTFTYADSSTSTSTQAPPGLRINNTDNTLGRLAGIHFAHGGAGTANAGIFHVTTNTATGSTTCLGDLTFYTKASGSSTMSERMRIDSSGRLLIGTDSSYNVGAGNATKLLVQSSIPAAFVATRDDGVGAIISLAKGKSATGVNTPVISDDTLGEIRFAGYDGTDFISQGASIRCLVDGTPGTNDMPGRLSFSTTAAGASIPTERMRITSAGKIGFGDSPANSNNVRFAGAITGNATMESLLNAGQIKSDVTNVTYFKTSAKSEDATFTTVGLYHFSAAQGALGANHTVSSQFGFIANGNLIGATNNYGFYSNIASGTGRWNFYANGDASNYFAGTTFFGTISSNSIVNGGANGAYVSGAGVRHSSRDSTAEVVHQLFYNPNGNVGSIKTSGSSTSFNTSSDYRLKENIAPIVGAADRVKALKPCRFNFKADADKTIDGFLAHEAQEVVPESVTGTKDETEAIGTLFDWDGSVREENVTEPEELTYTEEVEDEEGVATTFTRTMSWEKTGDRDVMQGIDQSKLVPLLTAALQEALARIEVLESKLA